MSGAEEKAGGIGEDVEGDVAAAFSQRIENRLLIEGRDPEVRVHEAEGAGVGIELTAEDADILMGVVPGDAGDLPRRRHPVPDGQLRSGRSRIERNTSSG